MVMLFAALQALLLSTHSRADTAEPETLLLSGPDWRIHDDPDGLGQTRWVHDGSPPPDGWIPAQVPGNIQADLESAHRLAPLWYGEGDPRLPDVARRDWWYLREFVIPRSMHGSRLTLVFDGVDEQCEVWLNGQRLGTQSCMFRRFWFDVTDAAHRDGPNTLLVRIRKMPDELLPYILRAPGAHFLDGINTARRMSRELRSATNFGWDWGVNIWTMGLWKDVRLVATGPVRIDWLRVQTALDAPDSQALVSATLDLHSSEPRSVRARFRIADAQGHEQAVTTVDARVPQGSSQLRADLRLAQPALWWPSGQGEQPLYTLRAEILPDGTDMRPDDVRSARFGVRDVKWIPTQGAPADFVSPYQLVINGRPVRTMGSNLLPPDLLFGRGTDRSLALLHRAREAGMNFLRLWGGGVILSDAFYDLADELGIMLSLEYPIANCWPEQDEVFLANLESTTRNIARQVRNHPSIIEYSGGNEMSWTILANHPAIDLMKRVTAEEDGRIFRATCPDEGASHGPYAFSIQSSYRFYDGPIGSQQTPKVQSMRLGEFCASSPSNLETWLRDIPTASQWPLDRTSDPVLIRKNAYMAMGPDGWLGRPQIEEAFGPAASLRDLIRAGQFLGAEGLRYAIDALRRKGHRLGGFSSWDFNEPWPNAAGSDIIDYDGQPLMNFDFVQQALAPISLTLRYDSMLYRRDQGIQADLFLTSDAPEPADGLHWQWLARDRRGTVLDHGNGVASIAPGEVKTLAAVHFNPPAATAAGLIFIELRLENAAARTLVERLHILAPAGIQAPLAGLIDTTGPDPDDDQVPSIPIPVDPTSPRNLAFIGNGAHPATASSTRPEPIHQPAGLNDGLYGNSHSWIADASGSSFQIDLGTPALIGRFQLGRDRTGEFHDRPLQSLRIETSPDAATWTPVFESSSVDRIEAYSPTTSMIVDVPPTQARHVRVTVDPVGACLDEFEVYGPDDALDPAGRPQVRFDRKLAIPRRPVSRTSLEVVDVTPSLPAQSDALTIRVRNNGPMTALFCKPEPLLAYRTDLEIEHRNAFIPPGETRSFRIHAPASSACGLSLVQTGWRLTSWNADDLVIPPAPSVLLSRGRRDAMCREFAAAPQPAHEGSPPDPSAVPFLITRDQPLHLAFHLDENAATHPARLRFHTADQASDAPTHVTVLVNGRSHSLVFPAGLGTQRDDPQHLAFPATQTLDLPPPDLHTGENTVEIQVHDVGWLTWDAIDILSLP
jgi:beta-mannosidase